MPVIEIRKAEREGARLVIGLAGVSGGGKTYTALTLAEGLANGNMDKVGFLDAENGRGRLYADKFPGFWHADLYAPFSPARYREAVLEFAKAGVEVLVVDSFSHEWEGIGGCEEIAKQGRGPDGWKHAKAAHKELMNTLLTCPMHIILCLRAREKVDFTNPRAPVNLGLQPITEKNVMFEMTASLMVHDQGRAQEVIKCPDDLMPFLGRGRGYISSDDGLAMRKWVDGAKQLDPELERVKAELQTVTQRGTAALQKAWGELTKPMKAKVGAAFLDQLKAAAAAFDAPPVDQGDQPASVARLNAGTDGVEAGEDIFG